MERVKELVEELRERYSDMDDHVRDIMMDAADLLERLAKVAGDSDQLSSEMLVSMKAMLVQMKMMEEALLMWAEFWIDDGQEDVFLAEKAMSLTNKVLGRKMDA